LLNVIVPIVLSLVGNATGAQYEKAVLVTGYVEGKPQMLAVNPIYQIDRFEEPLYLSKKAANAFTEMMGDAAAEGFHLKAISAFRTHRQQKMLRKQKGIMAAPAGWSNHQQGLSVDIAGTRRTIKGKKHKTILYWWLVRNAKKYKFYNDVPNEPWHWTFKEMRDYG